MDICTVAARAGAWIPRSIAAFGICAWLTLLTGSMGQAHDAGISSSASTIIATLRWVPNPLTAPQPDSGSSLIVFEQGKAKLSLASATLMRHACIPNRSNAAYPIAILTAERNILRSQGVYCAFADKDGTVSFRELLPENLIVLGVAHHGLNLTGGGIDRGLLLQSLRPLFASAAAAHRFADTDDETARPLFQLSPFIESMHVSAGRMYRIKHNFGSLTLSIP